jgi:HAD superfamily hydrolase (TIGR01456 family)
VTVDELHATLPHLYPDLEVSASDLAANKRNPEDMFEGGAAGEGFGAVLAFTDPITWGRELQIVTDVVSAPKGNIFAVESEQISHFKQHVPIYNACADFTYAAKWPVARFGSGAFRVSLEKLWSELSNEELSQTLYGKPHKSQYQFVETLLTDFHTSQQMTNGASSSPPPSSSTSIDRYYMIGDNPTTDIRGARGAGSHWKGVLTRSGLWKGGDNDAQDPADVVVEDVLEAVHWILKQEGVVP